MARRPDHRLAEDIGRGIMKVRRAMFTEAQSRLESQGQDLLAWQVLNQLDQHGALAQHELAQRTGQHPTGLSRLLDDLERHRFVRRARDPRDRRRVRAAITPPGKLRLLAGRPAVHDAVLQVLAPLGPAERRVLRDLLARVVGESG